MIWKFCTSTVGKKYLMGLSALVWTGFVAAHMAGNMLIFVSPEAYNTYGHTVTTGALIYVVEALLVLALVTHVSLAISLTRQNRSARPSRYAMTAPREKGATLASRTMAVQGSIILVFIILHLITFKYGPAQAEGYKTMVNGVEMRDLARLMFEVFSQPGYVAWYIIALVLLGFHLRHGVGSMFHSFGLLHPTYQRPIKVFGVIYAVVVALGFISQPLYVYLFRH